MSTERGASNTPRTWPEAAHPTPEQALAWLRVCTDEEGVRVLARLRDDEETSMRCFIEDHRRRIDGDQERLYALLRQREAVLALRPEDHATKSRDYGRGFAEALRLVREAMSSTNATITFQESAAYFATHGGGGKQPAEPPSCTGCGAPDTTGWACCSECWPEDDKPDLDEYDRDRIDDR